MENNTKAKLLALGGEEENSEKNFCNFLWGEQNFLREERGGSELKKNHRKKKEAKKRQRTES